MQILKTVVKIFILLYKGVFLMLSDIIAYVFSRIFMLWLVVATIVQVLIIELATFKRNLTRLLFWGRGNSYAYLSQLLVVLVIGGISLVAMYTTPITSKVYSSTEYQTEIEVAQTDLLLQMGSVETLIPKGRPSMDMREYIVKPGDTLSSIAARFEINIDTLKWANGITNVHMIKPGQKLTIPPGDGVVYTVKEGDTLASIAKKFSAAEQAIAEMNWLDPPFNIKAGTTLFIPDGTMPQPKPVVASNSGNNTAGSSSSGGSVNVPYVAPPTDGSVTRFLHWPIAGGKGIVTQCAWWGHVAIDIADRSAPDIVAPAAGTVIFAGMRDPNGYAWTVQVDHGNGYTTLYAHLQKIYVSVGQHVDVGTPLGKMGATGFATGIHLHFELRKGSSYYGRINPAPYMVNHVCGY